MNKFIIWLVSLAMQCSNVALLGTGSCKSGTNPIFVESVGGTTNGSTNAISVTLGTNTTGLNEDIGVAIFTITSTAGNCNTSGISTVTDSGSQTYTFVWGIFTTGTAGGGCIEMFHKSSSASGISSVSITLQASATRGGALVWHAKNIFTGNDSGTSSAPSATSQGTPFSAPAGGVTSASTEFMVAITLSIDSVFNSGIQNALLYTGSWIQGETLCSQSATSPCSAQTPNLDGSNGSVFGFAYQIVAPSSLQNTGTNNGSANTYKNFPGIAGFK